MAYLLNAATQGFGTNLLRLQFGLSGLGLDLFGKKTDLIALGFNLFGEKRDLVGLRAHLLGLGINLFGEVLVADGCEPYAEERTNATKPKNVIADIFRIGGATLNPKQDAEYKNRDYPADNPSNRLRTFPPAPFFRRLRHPPSLPN